MSRKRKRIDDQSHRICGKMDEHRRLAAISPEYRRRAREIEYETRRFNARYAVEGLRTGIVRIPVVVHILWNTPDQNPSDSEVQVQIDSLNADFRLTNADAVNIPDRFAAVAADTRIEFALAQRDPNCVATNGIERRQVSQTGFPFGDESFKLPSMGLGQWPPQRYLNIWVVNLTGGVIGYSNYPADLGPYPLRDGVVLSSYVFGVTPAHVGHALGRIATHEVGHWLNLIHIWGDASSCAGSDQCADTPNQSGATYGPPAGSFPTSCGNGPAGGNMYMNHMDYTDEEYKCMFTADQALRMHAALSVERSEILSSDGLIPPDAPATPDLWMQLVADDTGVEPYTGSGSICGSDDIWVRNGADGLTYQDHQNPNAEQLNMVYVRVRNRGCPGAGTQSGTVRLYWAKASPSLSWPAPWDGSVISPALMGGEIGNGMPVTVAGGAQQIVSFPWIPPDPSTYASFGADKAHFCLLARIEIGSTAPFGMTFPETTSLPDNVRNNNNIIWKNMSIVDTDGPFQFADVVIGQFDRVRRVARYSFEIPKRLGPTVFDWGFVLVEPRGKALAPWLRGDLRGEGFEHLEDGRLMITKPKAWVAAPKMKQGQFGTLHLRFIPNEGSPVGARVLELDLTERDAKGRFLGAQRFLLKTGIVPGPRWDDQLDTFDGVDWVIKPDRGCKCSRPD